jgi:hypothetical protein
MKNLIKITTTIVLSIFIKTNAIAQTPAISNAGVFYFVQEDNLWNHPVTDNQGNLYYHGQVRNSISLIGENLGSPNHEIVGVYFVKLTSKGNSEIHKLIKE